MSWWPEVACSCTRSHGTARHRLITTLKEAEARYGLEAPEAWKDFDLAVREEGNRADSRSGRKAEIHDQLCSAG